MIAPLAPALPTLGAGAHMIPRNYLYRNSPLFYVQVIQHYRNWGASAAGQSLNCSKISFKIFTIREGNAGPGR